MGNSCIRLWMYVMTSLRVGGVKPYDSIAAEFENRDDLCM
jgi:hypothetical protein